MNDEKNDDEKKCNMLCLCEGEARSKRCVGCGYWVRVEHEEDGLCASCVV